MRWRWSADWLDLTIGTEGLDEGTGREEKEEEGEKCGVGETSILATSSTILLEAICTTALEELLLELEARRGPEMVEDEEEEDEEEEVVVDSAEEFDPTEADGLPRLRENADAADAPMTKCLEEWSRTLL